MITLLTYPAAAGEFSSSPFCTKAAYLLALAEKNWHREDTMDPRKMQYGKLPVIRTEERLIADSDAIREFLEADGTDFDVGLSDLDKANARAFIRMAEEHFYFHLVLDRWADDSVWSKIREIYFSSIPKPLRAIVANRLRRQLLRSMQTHGLGRFSAPERMLRIEPDLQAVAKRLWATRYLFGDCPSAADCSVAAMLGAMRATPVDTELKIRVASDALISDYIDRMQRLLP